MVDSKLFIQKAIRLNYFDLTSLTKFFEKYSYTDIPKNIGEILLEENLLTQEQIDDITQKLGSLQISNTPPKEKGGDEAFSDSIDIKPSDTKLSLSDTIDIESPSDTKLLNTVNVKSPSETKILLKTIDIESPSNTKLLKTIDVKKSPSETKVLLNTIDITPPSGISPQNKTSEKIDLKPEETLRIESIILDKYRIIAKLGSGGMATVYKVEHLFLKHKKFFALKIMHPFLVDNELNYKRFVREVEMAISITHKNIISIREFGILPNNQGPYLTMDLSPGQTLEQILEEWSCDINKSLDIIYQILDALQEAHKLNIVHRDLKPANILIEKDGSGKDIVKIVDFGLARLVETEDEITHGTVGTPKYMSPEQAAGEKIDQRSDLYSVGIILYQLVTRGVPYDGRDWSKKRARLFLSLE